MRVATRARPARGPRWNTAISGCGFFSLNSAMRRTWSLAVIGLSTVTVTPTALPFSTSGGTLERHPAGLHRASRR